MTSAVQLQPNSYFHLSKPRVCRFQLFLPDRRVVFPMAAYGSETMKMTVLPGCIHAYTLCPSKLPQHSKPAQDL